MSSEDGLSTRERAAVKERAAELRTAGRRGKAAEKAAAERKDVVDKIAAMPQPDRGIAERLHDIITATVPESAPKLWYGQPAYALGGKVLCFFRSGQGDKERYSTFGFSSAAALDSEDGLWATSFALTELTPAAEARIKDLLGRAAG